MENLHLENLTSTFFYGAYSTLLPSTWKDNNVSMAMAKIYYVVKGSIFIVIDKKTIQVNSGEMIIIPPSLLHDYYVKQKAEKYWFHFAVNNLNSDFFRDYKFADKIKVTDKKTVEKLFWDVLYPDEKHPLTSEIKIHSSILQLLSYYIEKGGYSGLSKKTTQMQNVQQYIANNRNTELNLSGVAKNFGYSYTYLIRKFKTSVGTTPVQYKNKLKIEKAKRLLETTDLYISEIMERVGFKDSAYFSKLFKKQTGFAPRVYKELYKKNKPSKKGE